MDTVRSETRPTIAIASLILGLLSLALITVVSFIALALACFAMITGGVALAKSSRGRLLAASGMLAAGVAVAIFLVEVA